ncbi:selenide, water dikinase SelD [Lignipirellula cremea]|uniref:Selenide, water dikinase n=1 Tax=Lignipirellula cremea TaxID=2528010 RepID=A0A518E1L3_9BACT|nr:selenide, water dikinase SelD [Lignipirellula cremea]QDU97980.1 Selenide, water dikinase [Lignipirellula cremea]
MQATLPKYEVVLLGVGHTNAHVLRMWRMRPFPDARLTCISNFPVSTYSGMLPGVLAGDYPPQRMEIDLVRLCAASGARLLLAEVSGLDIEGRRLLFTDRPPLPFDALSIGIGSVPSRAGLRESDDLLLPIKPMQTFLGRLQQRCEQALARQQEPVLKATIVGGGAGGVEIALCLPGFVQRLAPGVQLELTLVHGGEQLLGDASHALRRKVQKEFEKRGVNLRMQQRVVRACRNTVELDSGQSFPADVVLWATGAKAPPLLEKLGLPVDGRGFLLIEDSLRTTAQAPIFAVGDSGTLASDPTPKAGVYAVRQGPILWENLDRVLRGETLQPYRPQSGFLKLLNTGDGRAILDYHGLAAQGRWAWKLKDAIDGRFMDKYQNYEPPAMDGELLAPNEGPVMRCLGCGGKVAGSVLSAALARLAKQDRLRTPAASHLAWGRAGSDDAILLRVASGQVMVSNDFFAAPFDDPYLVGRIAALHAASDLFASGARPTAALAMAELPLGSPIAQEELLYQTLAGAAEEFARMDAVIAGGHTLEGPRFTIGFTVLGELTGEQPTGKDGLAPGDRLILTKPLGTGVLLAAHALCRCRGRWWESLLAALLRSNQSAAAAVPQFGLQAATDITGFGLAGHLFEMLDASGLSAELPLDGLPLLPGAETLLGEQLESTLAPANRACEDRIDRQASDSESPRYAALFDPQTCGGLLLAAPADKANEVVAWLQEQGDSDACIIGQTEPQRDDRPRLRLI